MSLYEEYHPYGTSSYRSWNGSAEVSAKRYRYTGKERDEETSLYYHGARYYAPWLGRWMSADPAGTVDGSNLFAYVRGSPVVMSDPSGTQSTYGYDDPDDPGMKALAQSGGTARPRPVRRTLVQNKELQQTYEGVREGLKSIGLDVQAFDATLARKPTFIVRPNEEVDDPETPESPGRFKDDSRHGPVFSVTRQALESAKKYPRREAGLLTHESVHAADRSGDFARIKESAKDKLRGKPLKGLVGEGESQTEVDIPANQVGHVAREFLGYQAGHFVEKYAFATTKLSNAETLAEVEALAANYEQAFWDREGSIAGIRDESGRSVSVPIDLPQERRAIAQALGLTGSAKDDFSRYLDSDEAKKVIEPERLKALRQYVSEIGEKRHGN